MRQGDGIDEDSTDSRKGLRRNITRSLKFGPSSLQWRYYDALPGMIDHGTSCISILTFKVYTHFLGYGLRTNIYASELPQTF